MTSETLELERLKCKTLLEQNILQAKKLLLENLMKIRVDFQTTKYLVLVWFWKRKCPPYEQR